ncbi:MAG: adenylate/guanylate cyclase domain-containing protein [Thermoleophilaceae bacterium]
MSCGAKLEAGPGPPRGPVAQPERPPEERRHVTVLFADLSGYTAVAERMDPEAVKSLVERSLRRLGLEIERFGGTIDKYIGDNVMALFGAPVAHEDDEERAVRAALGMQAAMEEINQGLPAESTFALRAGINSGEVLAGSVGDGYTVTGDTVNVASRLQTVGRPGAVTVGRRTVQATQEAVLYKPLEPLQLKGRAEPVPAWEAVGLKTEHTVRRTYRPGGAALVGRDHELGVLNSIYRRAMHEEGAQLVTLIGEAGVGKSRLLGEFGDRAAAADPPAELRTGRCLPYGSRIVYWALGEVVRAEAGIVGSDTSDEAWEKLCAYVADLLTGLDERGETPERRAAQIGRSLGLDVPPELVPADTGDPERMREAFFSALRSVIQAAAVRRPLVLAFEDIHWADDGMLEAIEHLAQWVRAPLLILCVARDELLERRPGWGGGRPNATRLLLEPLTAEHSRALVTALLGEEEGLPADDAVEMVAKRSGGNPLFAEEMVRRLEEEGTAAVGELPDTVQAVLAARLDALDPFERRVVQEAAVVGRTFWEGSLSSLAESEGRSLSQTLATLQEKDILAAGAEGLLAGERELAFKHVLIRDVAYGMLPKAVRCRRHFEVGRFLEERAGDRSEEVVALLAEHYGRAAALGSEAGVGSDELAQITERAVIALEDAGDAAARLYANREAVAHYGHALEVRGDRSDGEAARIGEKQGDVALRIGRVDAAVEIWEKCLEHRRREEDLDRMADLHRKLGAALAVKGERKAAIENYQRGINLLKDGSPRPELVRLYEEAAWLYLQTGDNMLAIYASEKALRLAERLGETQAASRAHGIFGRVFGRIGDTEKARSNLERSVELARASDPCETILALFALGRHLELSEADVRAAGRAYDEALSLAEQVGDLPSQVELHSARAQLAAYRADWDQVGRSTDASTRLAEREGLVSKLGLPYALRGLLRWREGDLEGAEQHFRQAHRLAEQVGWSELAFQALYGLSLCLRDRGEHADAVTALGQALGVSERAGLGAQSIQATAGLAVAFALGDRPERARELAAEARRLAEQLHYPIAAAAALEADGASCESSEQGVALLSEAEAAWTELERPLEAARCRLLAGFRLRSHDPRRARRLLDGAAAECERLGVEHLAQRAQSLMPA